MIRFTVVKPSLHSDFFCFCFVFVSGSGCLKKSTVPTSKVATGYAEPQLVNYVTYFDVSLVNVAHWIVFINYFVLKHLHFYQVTRNVMFTLVAVTEKKNNLKIVCRTTSCAQNNRF